MKLPKSVDVIDKHYLPGKIERVRKDLEFCLEGIDEHEVEREQKDKPRNYPENF
jgi:hypothetical protein